MQVRLAQVRENSQAEFHAASGETDHGPRLQSVSAKTIGIGQMGVR